MRAGALALAAAAAAVLRAGAAGRRFTRPGLARVDVDRAPVTIGGDGTAYIGVLGGLVAIRDGTRP